MFATFFGRTSAAVLVGFLLQIAAQPVNAWVLPDTDQEICFDDMSAIPVPEPGDPFYGQDACYSGAGPAYLDNGDGTVTDLNTGLMWQQSLPTEKMTWDEAVAGADTCHVGGYTDWRLPTIKELYSLIEFSGTDPSGPVLQDPIPFIDTTYFQFQYGDTLSGERIIDAQYWSSTVYRGLTMNGDSTAFGVNFADGRIKGYPFQEVGPPGRGFQMTAFVRYVRGDSYGDNQFVDNGDGTVTDTATGLMWQQSDDGVCRNWEEALEYAENLELAGYDDWTLPDAHQLQSIVDYTRSLQYTGSPAIDPVFSCTQITDEGGEPNYGYYWTGTTHETTAQGTEGQFAVYVSFGEALGWMMTPDSTSWILMDVHGAGAQRSDPKSGDPWQYPHGHGPQGDVVRIYNFVRCVRVSETGMDQGDAATSSCITLAQAGTNPASGLVTFLYSTPLDGHGDISVYDVCGRRVATLLCGQLEAGAGTACWNAEDAPPGTYLCVFSSLGELSTDRITLVR